MYLSGQITFHTTPLVPLHLGAHMPVNPFLFAWSTQMWSVLQGPATITLFLQTFLDALMRVMSSSLWTRSRYWLSEWCGGEWIAISPATSRWLAMTLFLKKILSCSISFLRGRRADFDEECSSVYKEQELMYHIFPGLDWTLKALRIIFGLAVHF